jgi:hypothetical protein
MNMHTLRNYKNQFCGLCPAKDCTYCKVRGFVNFIGLKETPRNEVKDLMRSNVPVDVRHTNGKFVQKNGRVLK